MSWPAFWRGFRDCLRVLIGGFMVFCGITVFGFVLVLIDRFGVEGAAMATGVLTWVALAVVGVVVLLDRFLKDKLENMQIRAEFVVWYADRVWKRGRRA